MYCYSRPYFDIWKNTFADIFGAMFSINPQSEYFRKPGTIVLDMNLFNNLEVDLPNGQVLAELKVSTICFYFPIAQYIK